MKKNKDLKNMILPHKNTHFVGIGGVGMSAIARILLEQGYKVSGSDLKESINTIRLKDMGAKVFYKHKENNLREAHVIIISSAINQENPEYKYAVANKISIFKRAELLGYLMNKFNKKISVCGTHGKTTTGSIITRMLDYINLSPTYLIGADTNDFGGNAALGKGEYFVAESDESDGSFLFLNPNIAVITNIEAEHMDYYKTFDNLLEHFQKFMRRVCEHNGYLIINQDNEALYKLSLDLPAEKIIYYGITSDAQIKADNMLFSAEGTTFDCFYQKEKLGTITLKTYGAHNVSNSLAAVALGLKEGLAFNGIKESLALFSGTKRRMQFIGEINGIKVYDDYGHHPTEIKVTLEGIKNSFNKRIFCIFQPHRYSRTFYLLEEFSNAFDDADKVIITEIYSAYEDNSYQVSGNLIVNNIQKKNKIPAQFIAQKGLIAAEIIKELKPNDIVITMGAGDIYTVGKEILAQLKSQAA